MRSLGFQLNEGFSGYSRFQAAADYGRDFQSYLVSAGPRPLIMCHPGFVDDEFARLDPATESGRRRWRFSSRPASTRSAPGQACARRAFPNSPVEVPHGSHFRHWMPIALLLASNVFMTLACTGT